MNNKIKMSMLVALMLLGIVLWPAAVHAAAAPAGTCRITKSVKNHDDSVRTVSCDSAKYSGKTVGSGKYKAKITADKCWSIHEKSDGTADSAAALKCDDPSLNSYKPSADEKEKQAQLTGTTDSSKVASACSARGLEPSAADPYSCVASGGGDAAFGACKQAASSAEEGCGILQKYVNPLIDLFSIIAGIVITGTIIYGGILYSASGGDSSKVSKAKNLIRTAILSIIGYALLYTFLQWLVPGGLFG